LILYLTCIGSVIVGIAIAIRAIRRGALWIAPIQHLVMRIPGIGRAIKTLAIARFSWTLHVTLESGMEIRKALTLALQSTQNAYYTTHNDEIVRQMTLGRELNEGMAAGGAFSPEFTDAIEVGERSGRLVETLAVLSKQYQEQAIYAISYLTRGAGLAVWLLVALTIIMLIFRVFSFYAGVLNDAVKGI
jgi:type IV pilus assembly protein PilC